MTGLKDRRVVVTAPRGSDLAELLRGQGAEVVEFPTIDIVDPTSWDPMKNAARAVESGNVDWVLFTSRNAVTRALPFLEKVLAEVKVGAVGSKTAALLERSSVRVDVVPPGGTGRHLSDAVGPGPGTVVIPRSEGAPRDAIEMLEGSGWKVVDPPAYRTVAAEIDETALASLRDSDVDAITFTSGSTARHLVEVVRPEELALGEGQQGPLVACIGPATADAARAVSLRVDVVADPHTNEGLVDALVSRLGADGVGR